VLKKKSLTFADHFGPLSAKRKRQTGLVRDKSKTTAQLIATVKDDPSVELVEPNYLRWVRADPNDTRFAEMWGLKNTGQTVNGTAGTASADVKFVEARSLARTPLGEIVVGVIDTGLISGTSSITGSAVFTAQVTDSLGATDTQLLTLQAAATGPLDHFTWDYQPNAVYAGAPFAVQITARDAGNRIIPADAEVSGSIVNLAATSPSGGTALNLSPASITLAEGAFAGYLTIASAAESVTLTATQGSASGTSGSFTVKSGVSTANDGIPDAWKSAYGLSSATNLATVDSDGDGRTNLHEYVAGTNPTSPSSALQITSASITAGAGFALRFTGVAGKLYRVSETSDFATWTPLSPSILATATGTQQVTLNLTGETKLFFRVEIVP
jgi:hypothetical protein